MNKTRWNLLLVALLLANLIRWMPLGGLVSTAGAHPAFDDPPPMPDTVITAYDEEWDAVEVAGTCENSRQFLGMPVPRAHGSPTWSPERLGVAAVFAREEGSPPPGHLDAFEKKESAVGAAATLVVTRWRVRGHMHRGRGRP